MATNRVYESGKVLRVAVASTIVSGDPVVVGELSGGVALTDYHADDGKATVDFGGVYDLSVKGVNDSGNVAVAVGDALYYKSGDAFLSKKSDGGIFFGHALEGVTSSATATINVRSGWGASGGGGSVGSPGVFITPETTATGSSQSIAHPFGSVPSAMMVALTDIVSGQHYIVTEGTNTTSNIVLTVAPSGAKFKVIALK